MAYQFEFASTWDYRDIILNGLVVTLKLTALGSTLGVALGIFGAWARTQGPSWLAAPVRWYVELIRNTPFLVQLFFIFFGLPSIGFKITEMEAAVLAMVINLGAYSTEIVRAGIEAIGRGQLEAARSLAMSRFEVFRYIVLRPALQKIWPALSSQVVIVMLGSAVCSQISVEELSYAANYIQGRNFRAFEAYVVVTVVYLFLALALRQLLRLIGRHFVFQRSGL